MSLRENSFQVIDMIKPQNILVSVFDKSNLDVLVKGIMESNPNARFYSTGGTGKKIAEILGSNASKNYTSVEEFTGAPEMEGGLVKTLHPKIHAGLLAERGNPSHEDYLFKTLADPSKGGNGISGVYFDVFVGNLYPFTSVVAKSDTTPEIARINIDIGGPTMTMAGAKNWHSVAVLINPGKYNYFNHVIKHNDGMIPLELRFMLAKEAMTSIGDYRTAIGNYFSKIDFDKNIKPQLDMK